MVRSAKASNSEEPCAVIPHAGVCGGAVGQLAVLPYKYRKEHRVIIGRIKEDYRRDRNVDLSESHTVVVQAQKHPIPVTAGYEFALK